MTTEAVLWEWMNALADPATRGTATEGYRRCHEDPQIEIVPFCGELVESAVKLYADRADKSWSVTDCLSFVVIEQRQLTRALTTDHHFQQAGLQAVLLHDPPESPEETSES